MVRVAVPGPFPFALTSYPRRWVPPPCRRRSGHAVLPLAQILINKRVSGPRYFVNPLNPWTRIRTHCLGHQISLIWFRKFPVPFRRQRMKLRASACKHWRNTAPVAQSVPKFPVFFAVNGNFTKRRVRARLRPPPASEALYNK
jgi:hypothetical protein